MRLTVLLTIILFPVSCYCTGPANDRRKNQGPEKV